MKTQWSAKYRSFILLLLSLTLLLAAAPSYAGIINGNVGRQAYLPVTFTAEGWAFFCNPDNGIIPGGMVYNRFPIAFSCFRFQERPGALFRELPNELRVGDGRIYIR